MSYYFKLQGYRLKRWFQALSIPLYVGIIGCILVFIGLSSLLFYKTSFAPWIYIWVAVSVLIRLGNKDRTNLIKLIYPKQTERYIRVIENVVAMIPFMLYLLYEMEYAMAAGLLIGAAILGMLVVNISWSRVLPTPFRKHPFELIVGFRSSFLGIAFMYFLLLQSILVNNYNLGAVSLGALFLVVMSFYMNPESTYFVWIYKDTSKMFLLRKMKVSSWGAFMIVTPALLTILVAFPEMAWVSVIIYMIGFIYTVSMVVAKYSAFPAEMNLPQGILYAVSLWFPPMLLIIILLFHKQSLRRLEPILE